MAVASKRAAASAQLPPVEGLEPAKSLIRHSRVAIRTCASIEWPTSEGRLRTALRCGTPIELFFELGEARHLRAHFDAKRSVELFGSG